MTGGAFLASAFPRPRPSSPRPSSPAPSQPPTPGEEGERLVTASTGFPSPGVGVGRGRERGRGEGFRVGRAGVFMLSGHVFLPVLSFARMSAIDRIVFFGTPEFAVPTLAALVAAGRAPVRVVTQPARPAGRGQRPQDPPVARWARDMTLPVA